MNFIFLNAEMGDSNKQICRVCLEITPASECETIEKSKKELLEVLLINIDFDRSDNAVACNRCLERLQNCFDFKSQINTFVDVDVKMDFEKASQACQLCMSLIKDEAFNYVTDSKDGVLLKDMMRNCLPEVDFDSDYEQLICNLCVSSIKNYYEFMKNCQEVEQRIENYCQMAGHGTTGTVNLEDMLFRNCDTLSKSISVKNEYSDGENVNVNIQTYPKIEDAENIECGEVYIKDELGNRVEMSEDDPSKYSDGSGKNDSSKSKRNVRKCESKGKRHFCPKCPYSSKTKGRMKQHMHFHSDNEVHRCSLCPFTTNARLSLKAHHKKSHKGSTKAFGCHACSYETDVRCALVRHSVKHKDTLEVEMYKCALCQFQSKYKSALMMHQKMHDKNIKMYKCEECSFRTKHEKTFERHRLRHRKPDEFQKLRCDKCEFGTEYKANLVRHRVTHEDPELTSRFRCEKCPYRSKWQHALKRHMMTHSNEHLYSCDECSFSSNNSISLYNHMLSLHQKNAESNNQADHMDRTHAGPYQAPKWKCIHCTYETTLKQLLSRHIRLQHTSKDHRCSLCPFTTNTRLSLKAHHKKSHTKAFSCHACSYETDIRCALVRHLVKHKDTLEVKMYKCALCQFQSKYKSALVLHQKVHDKNRKTYKCEECLFSTKHEETFERHQLRHKKGDKCKFGTEYKANLVSHKMMHEDSNTFKCDKCPYRSKWQHAVKRHMMIHSSEHLYSCDECSFSSNYSINLYNHTLSLHQKNAESNNHMDKTQAGPYQAPKWKCIHCTYETTLKQLLSRHIRLQHTSKDQPVRNM